MWISASISDSNIVFLWYQCAKLTEAGEAGGKRGHTVVAVIRDELIKTNLSITNCRGQCYDDASNMVGAKSGVATQIKNDEPRAILIHCYVHTLHLAVGGTVKGIKLLENTLDTTYEISKLIF